MDSEPLEKARSSECIGLDRKILAGSWCYAFGLASSIRYSVDRLMPEQLRCAQLVAAAAGQHLEDMPADEMPPWQTCLAPTP